MDAAIYLRVSSQDQVEGASLTTQVNDCRRYCQNQDMSVIAEYQDVQSGSRKDRIDYQRMLADARAGRFQFIVVWRYDRFGRDNIESGQQIQNLLDVGVEVHSATEGYDEDKRDFVLLFAKMEQRNLSRRVAGGRKTRSESGLRSGKACFGYVNVSLQGGGITLEAHPTDAPMVTECFRRYATGRFSLADMRDYIASNSTSGGKLITRTAIHYMLKNPTYLGQIRHGQYARSKVIRATPSKRQAAIFQIEGKHPGLVDQETFDKVQEIMAGHKLASKATPNTPFLFTGMVKCSCGARYTGHKNGKVSRSYYCTRKNDQGTCTNKSVNEVKLKDAIIKPLEQVVIEWLLPEARMAMMQRDSELVQRQRKAESAGKDGLAEELARLEKRLAGFQDMRADGEMTREQFAQRQDEILPQIASLKEQLAAAPAKVQTLEPVLKALELLDVDAEGHLVKGGQPLDVPDWRWLLSMTLEQVTIVDGAPEVTWKEFVSMDD